jgi:hypothetical protein
MYCLIVLPLLLQYAEYKKKSDQQLICYVEIHIDDPLYFHPYMDLTSSKAYWIKFCRKLIAMISHDNYYSQSSRPSCELVQ